MAKLPWWKMPNTEETGSVLWAMLYSESGMADPQQKQSREKWLIWGYSSRQYSLVAGSRISKNWSSWLRCIQRKDAGGHKCQCSLMVFFFVQPKTPVLEIFSTTVKVGPPTPMNLTAIIPHRQAHPRACLDYNQYWPPPFPILLLKLENSGLLLFSNSSP